MKPTKPQKTKLAIQFKGTLSKTVLALPKGANAKLPGKGRVVVEGVINYLPFRAPLEPDNKGGHFLKVDKTMSDAVGVTDGNKTTVEITRVEDEPEIRMPSDLSRALAAIPLAKKSWLDITPMARRDWIFSICTAKQSETRKRRIDKAVDMLADGHRRLCCFPGIKWMMKENAKSCGMWQRLPN